MGQNVVDCRLQVKEVETGFGRQTEKGPERLVEHLVKEVETGFGRQTEKGWERLVEHLVKEVETGFGRQAEKRPERLVKEFETGFGRLAEIGVLQEENDEDCPSQCPACWIVTAPLGPNQN